MRLTRPRLTIRRLMLLVAMVGVLAGFWIEGARRRQRFQTIAGTHRDWLSMLRVRSVMKERKPDPALMVWVKTMGDKYEFAARYPWLPVWPDPPKPQDGAAEGAH